ncbi:hypothetical protein D9M71_789660 [compost metagenome]
MLKYVLPHLLMTHPLAVVSVWHLHLILGVLALVNVDEILALPPPPLIYLIEAEIVAPVGVKLFRSKDFLVLLSLLHLVNETVLQFLVRAKIDHPEDFALSLLADAMLLPFA